MRFLKPKNDICHFVGEKKKKLQHQFSACQTQRGGRSGQSAGPWRPAHLHSGRRALWTGAAERAGISLHTITQLQGRGWGWDLLAALWVTGPLCTSTHSPVFFFFPDKPLECNISVKAGNRLFSVSVRCFTPAVLYRVQTLIRTMRDHMLTELNK